MSLNMSNNNAQSNHSSSTSSSDALVKFPSSNERASFDDWLFRAEVFLRAKGMLDVVRQPIFNLPEEKNGVFIRRANIQYLGLDDNDVLVDDKSRAKIADHSNKAFNYIVSSLPDKHLEIVKSVYDGNAFILMTKLKSTFGPIKSAVSTVALMMKLNANIKLSNETMNDYFARTERMFHDYANLSSNTIPIDIKKFHLLHGLKSDPEWEQATNIITQLDVDQAWSIEKLKQYLINQEDEKTAMKAKSDTSNHRDTHN